MRIKDPIHNFIQLTSLEVQIVNQPIFQRLRHIIQLGYANYVYPTAVHTRFDHCLGVAHTAGRMFDSIMENLPSKHQLEWFNEIHAALEATYGEGIEKNQKKLFEKLRELIRIAALLHDVGHAPASHNFEMGLVGPLTTPHIESIEQELLQEYELDSLSEILNHDMQIHEFIGHKIIHKYVDVLIETIAPWGPKFLVDLFEIDTSKTALTNPANNFARAINPLKKIVSGPIDADRCDYTLRDGYFTSKDGKFDLDRLLENMIVVKVNLVTTQYYDIAFRRKSVTTVSNFFIYRYHLYADVYLHITISLYDRIFALLLEIFLMDTLPEHRPHIKALYGRLASGQLHAVEHPNFPHENTTALPAIDPVYPLDDRSWELSVRRYITQVDLSEWQTRFAVANKWHHLPAGYHTASAIIANPKILFATMENRSNLPIRIWANYIDYKKAVVDPIIELLLQQYSIVEEFLKATQQIFNEGKILNDVISRFITTKKTTNQLMHYIAEGIIAERAFKFDERELLNHGPGHFDIQELAKPIFAYCKKKKLDIPANFFISTTSIIQYKNNVFFASDNFEVQETDLQNLRDVAPFFDPIIGKDQNRPYFLLYLQGTEKLRTTYKRHIPKFIEIIQETIKQWLLKDTIPGSNLSNLQYILKAFVIKELITE